MRLETGSFRAARSSFCIICNLALSAGLVQKELQIHQTEQAQQKKGLSVAANPLFLSVATGACTLDSNGCALSPNHPLPYGNNQGCTIRVNATAGRKLLVESFDVEESYDRLTVNGEAYSGSKKPVEIIPWEDITWFSDYASPAGGWKLCPGDVAGKEAGEPVVPFEVTKGTCTVDDKGCAMSTNYPDEYPVSEHCTIKVNVPSKPITVKTFGTEQGYDLLTVNGVPYSGLDGPEGLIPEGDITWYSDPIVAKAPGWKICMGEVGIMAQVQNRTSENTTSFEVMSGPCSVDKAGCALSPDWPKGYGNAESCSIRVKTETVGPLFVEGFGTENGLDILTVNGIRYSGSKGPDGVIPYEDITWHADPGVGGRGWKLCSGSKMEARMAAPHPTTWFEVKLGNCTTTSNGCIMSPNYPQEYGDGETCSIKVFDGNAMPLQVQDFATESHLDLLTVNGQPYSGVVGPSGVVPTGMIHWASDGSKRMAGWSLCLRATPDGFMV